MIINESKAELYEIGVDGTIEINAAPFGNPLNYKELNTKINDAISTNYKNIVLNNVCGQRFIGAAMQGNIEITINGVPGNDLGIFMDGPKIKVNGNCEDQSGNTMNQGTIIIDGDGGDVLGLSSRGGELYIKGDVGYRVGIHMKEYENQFPVIVIGGTAKDFLGEYMAGGKIIILGLKIQQDGTINESPHSICGTELGTGIHRGSIYLRTDENLDDKLGIGAKIYNLSEEEHKEITKYIAEFCKFFKIPMDIVWNKSFKVIKPISKRPFGGNYCMKSI